MSADEPIPESWPPDPPSPGSAVVPVFPLANVWLFPQALMPLHVFEPRYRQMVEDCLDGPGRIVMGTVVEGHEDEMPGAPPIHPIAGLGEILRHEKLDDGRFHIHVWGLTRVRIREVESDRLYRKVEAQPLIEIDVDPEVETQLREELVAAILTRSEDLLNLPENVPISILSDLLVLRLDLPHATLQELYAEADPARRARRALDEHAARETE